MQRTVKWHEDERVDKPDVEKLTTLVTEETRKITQFVGAPELTELPAAAVNTIPNATWIASDDDIVYEETTNVRITVKAGTSLLLAGGTSGDILSVDTDVILEGFCPTTAIPAKVLMARVLATPTDIEQDVRVFFKSATDGEEERTVATEMQTEIEWAWADQSVDQDLIDLMAAGYQYVALMTKVTTVYSTTWYYVLPKTAETAGAPGHTSVVQALSHITKQIGRILFTTDHDPSWWTKAPQMSIEALKSGLDAANVWLGIFSGYITTLQDGLASLAGRVTNIENKTMMLPRLFIKFTQSTGYPLANAGTGLYFTWEGVGVASAEIVEREDQSDGNPYNTFKFLLTPAYAAYVFDHFDVEFKRVDPDHLTAVPAFTWCPMTELEIDGDNVYVVVGPFGYADPEAPDSHWRSPVFLYWHGSVTGFAWTAIKD